MDRYEINTVKAVLKEGHKVVFRGGKRVTSIAPHPEEPSEVAFLDGDKPGEYVALYNCEPADFSISTPLFDSEDNPIQDVYRIFYERYAGEDDRNYRITRLAYDDVYDKDAVARWLSQLEADHAVERLQVDPRWRDKFDSWDRSLIEIMRVTQISVSEFKIDQAVVDAAVKQYSDEQEKKTPCR